MFRNIDAFRYEVIIFLCKRASVFKLGDNIEAIIWHLIGRYEYRLYLMLTPLIKSLVIEAGVFFDITFCSLVGNIAINYAIIGYFNLLIIKHT